MSATTRDLARRALVVGGVLMVLVALAGIAWRAFDVLLMVFGGILIAVFLRALADGLVTVSRLSEGWALVVVVAGIVLVVAAVSWFLSSRVADQVGELSVALPRAVSALQDRLEQTRFGRLLLEYIGRERVQLETSTRIVPAAAGAVSTGIKAIADAVLTLFIGLFIAVNPRLYARGVLRLVPPARREGAGAALAAVAATLRWWMVAQVTLMIVLGAGSALGLWLVGMPIALALGLLTGVLIFVPYLGAIAAYLVAVAIALAQSVHLAIAVTIVFLCVHVAEGYVLAPTLHWGIVSLPPALTIFAQALMFVLLGLPGVFFATPLVAATRVLVEKVYVERVLESPPAPGSS